MSGDGPLDELNGLAGTPGTKAPRTRRSEIFLLPNLFSLARIVLTPVFVLMMVQGRPWPAFIVFLAAGATDALDGFSARLLHLKSTLGLWLDPIGDKLLLTAAFVVLTIPAIAGPNALPLWLTVLCIGRDVAIAIGALIIVALRGRRTFPPTLAGKASTICQVFLMYFMLYLNAVGRTTESLAWLFILSGMLTAVSFIQYGAIGVGMLRKPPAPPAG